MSKEKAQGVGLMNTLQNLIDNGISEYTANNMLKGYKERIGTMNGIYKIIDINYDFSSKGRDVTLECSKCGKVIHRTMIKGRNKWSELIKRCPCQKEEKIQQEKIEREKSKQAEMDRISSDAQFLIGTEYGDYDVIGFGFDSERPLFTLKCRECGDIVTGGYKRVKENAKTYQKCHKHFVQPIKYDESYIGKKKNFLTVKAITRLPNKHRAFLCECDCGNTTIIEPTFWEQGIIKSCGCYSDSLKIEHTEELDRLRRIYSGMIQRCYNPNSVGYHNYGGRGILICEEWLNNRDKFIDWALQNGYSNDLTIDRIDVNGNYEPSNCRWVDWETQNRNKRPKSEWKKPKPRKLKTWTIAGETKSINEWCEQYNTSTVAISYRMKKMGMALEQALKTPKIQAGRPRKKILPKTI